MPTKSPRPDDASLTRTFGRMPIDRRPVRRVMLVVSDGPDRGAEIQAARQRLTL